jgi:uncharacterized membrane protein
MSLQVVPEQKREGFFRFLMSNAQFPEGLLIPQPYTVIMFIDSFVVNKCLISKH